MSDWESAIWVILVGALCNVACALLGGFLVLRRLSLLGDAISHAVLPGLAVGFLLSGQIDSWMLFAGAMAFGVLTSFLTETLRRYGGVPEDASLGVVFTALFALGVLLVVLADDWYPKADLDPNCVLHGKIDLVPLQMVPLGPVEVPQPVFTLAPVLLMTVGFVLVLWKELKVVSFDPQLATSVGIPAGVVHYLLMGMVAVVTVAAFRVVGSVLVVAMLIVPAAAAHLLTDRLGWMLLIAALLGVVAAAAGHLAAVAVNTNTAGAMTVAAGLLFAAAVLFSPRHGLIARGWQRLSLAVQISGEDVLALLYRAEERGGRGGLGLALCRQAAGRGLARVLAVPVLLRRGLVERSAGDVKLTDAGRDRARSLVRSHRLWEAYLVQHFDLPLDHLHEPAERVEHFITPALQEKLSAELENPTSDPHGRPIPREDVR